MLKVRTFSWLWREAPAEAPGPLRRRGAHFTDLFHDPSFWRGPIVPFVFGGVMAIFPADSSILVFNALVTELAAGVFVATLTWLGATPLLAAAAVACWLLYLPHHFVYGYYLAESLVALFVTLVLAAVSLALVKRDAAGPPPAC